MDYAHFLSGKWNMQSHMRCKKCSLAEKPPQHQLTKHGVAHSVPSAGNPMFVATASANFCAQPRLDIHISMPPCKGPLDVKMHGPMVNSGAQECLLPEHAINGSLLQP